jgi:alpha-N-arabinofuranosidase
MISQINPDTGEILTEPKVVWNGMGGRYPEAPHIYKKDGWYYLMIAEGGTEFAHSETIARSRNVEGPYDPAPHNPILTHFTSAAQGSPIQGVGHADLVEAHDGSWWLVCLAFRVNSGLIHLLGRETFVAPVRWDKNAWPVVNGNGEIALKMDVPTLPLKPFEAEPARNEFDEPLGPKWSWLRKPVEERYQIANGKLRMYGSAEGLNELKNSPSFVGFRQEDFDFQAETCVKLGNASNGDKAGMTVYMDYNGHYDVYVAKKGGKWVVGTNYTFGPVNHVEEVTVNSSKVWLRLTGNRSQYMLWYSTNGTDFKQVGTGDARFLSTETLGNFTGIMLGLWAQSPSVKGYADFDYFEYKQVEPQWPRRRRQ